MKAALLIYSDTDFGGAERRLIRIHNELGKKIATDLIVCGATKEQFRRRIEKADCNIHNFHNVVISGNRFKNIVDILGGGII